MSSNNTDTGDTTVMATATSVQNDVEAGVDEQLPRESLVIFVQPLQVCLIYNPTIRRR